MTVYEATIKRLEFVFSEFEYVYVSFSGGKDSGVLLNIAIDYVREHCHDRRLGVFHIDYEAQYQFTTDYVKHIFDSLPNFCDKYWVAIPLTVPSCTSMYGNHWIPWNILENDIWVRRLPEESINIQNHEFDFYEYGMLDYDFQKQFGDWIQRKTGKKTACLIGVRSRESMDRRIMLANKFNERKYKDVLWSTGGISDSRLQYNFYPIYDWTSEDIWIYNGRFRKPYNKLYDLFYKAGLGIDQMRVASPFLSQGLKTLHLYKVIEPNTWGRIVSRVNGVNFAGIYGGTTAMGWKSIKKPNGHTWKSYLEFLLSTLPEDTRKAYIKKFKVSEEFWHKRGGVLGDDVIGEIQQNTDAKIEIIEESNYKTIKRTVKFLEYPDELNIREFQAVPSYKRMVVCILKNDHLCKYMGFTMTKEEIERRKNIMEKYKNTL
jgi:predicted phosphoadenosine phosphosulfate sulfurtransferase